MSIMDVGNKMYDKTLAFDEVFDEVDGVPVFTVYERCDLTYKSYCDRCGVLLAVPIVHKIRKVRFNKYGNF